MVRGQIATSLEGERWRVRRRWIDRPVPNLIQRFRANLEKERGGSLLGGIDLVDSIWATVALAAILLLIVFVLLPQQDA